MSWLQTGVLFGAGLGPRELTGSWLVLSFHPPASYSKASAAVDGHRTWRWMTCRWCVRMRPQRPQRRRHIHFYHPACLHHPHHLCRHQGHLHLLCHPSCLRPNRPLGLLWFLQSRHPAHPVRQQSHLTHPRCAPTVCPAITHSMAIVTMAAPAPSMHCASLRMTVLIADRAGHRHPPRMHHQQPLLSRLEHLHHGDPPPPPYRLSHLRFRPRCRRHHHALPLTLQLHRAQRHLLTLHRSRYHLLLPPHHRCHHYNQMLLLSPASRPSAWPSPTRQQGAAYLFLCPQVRGLNSMGRCLLSTTYPFSLRAAAWAQH